MSPEQLIESYLETFRAVHPTYQLPRITYHKGWFRFRNSRGRKYRRSDMEKMQDRLLERIEERQ